MPQVTLETVIEVICEQNATENPKSITESSRLDALGLDSLDKMELVMALEERFKIEIDDDSFDKIVTVGDLVGILQSVQWGRVQ